MREPGAILLVACYELGHQPLTLAWPAAFLERRGYAPAVMDLAVEPFDAEKVAPGPGGGRVRAHAHGAAPRRSGGRARARDQPRLPPRLLRALRHAQRRLLEVARRRLRAGRRGGAGPGGAGGGPRGRAPDQPPRPRRGSRSFPSSSRAAIACRRSSSTRGSSATGARSWPATSRPAAAAGTSARHCPIPPVYGGRFFVVPREVVLADVRQLVEAGATHITFGDPDFLNGPGHALRGRPATSTPPSPT